MSRWDNLEKLLHGEKLSHLGEISPSLRQDLTYVEWIHSHINDLFLESEIKHPAVISFWWNVKFIVMFEPKRWKNKKRPTWRSMERSFGQNVMQQQQQMHETEALMLSVMMKVTIDDTTIKCGEYVANDGMTKYKIWSYI